MPPLRGPGKFRVGVKGCCETAITDRDKGVRLRNRRMLQFIPRDYRGTIAYEKGRTVIESKMESDNINPPRHLSLQSVFTPSGAAGTKYRTRNDHPRSAMIIVEVSQSSAETYPCPCVVACKNTSHLGSYEETNV